MCSQTCHCLPYHNYTETLCPDLDLLIQFATLHATMPLPSLKSAGISVVLKICKLKMVWMGGIPQTVVCSLLANCNCVVLLYTFPHQQLAHKRCPQHPSAMCTSQLCSRLTGCGDLRAHCSAPCQSRERTLLWCSSVCWHNITEHPGICCRAVWTVF